MIRGWIVDSRTVVLFTGYESGMSEIHTEVYAFKHFTHKYTKHANPTTRGRREEKTRLSRR